VVSTLCKICEADDYNRQILKKYVEKFGEIQCEINQTNLHAEIQKHPSLFDFICQISSSEQENLTSYEEEY